MGRFPIRAVLLIALSACAPATAPIVAPPTTMVPMLERPIPYPVAEPAGFARALANGTRTRTGEPGRNYWQQYARYVVNAALDTQGKTVSASARVTYYNRSPDALDRIVVRLYQNAYRAGSQRNSTFGVTTGLNLSRIAVNGVVASAVDTSDTTGVGVRFDGTLAHVRPSRPIASGDSALLEFQWSFPVPGAPYRRMGQDGEVFHIAYWYPQIAVYDDVSGWDVDQYLGDGEFYMGYADYDVSLTAPAGWIVSATGSLTNPDDVLSDRVRARLAEARRSGEIVHVVSADERNPGTSTAGGERLTWRFTARNVRDFTWNAGNRYVWDATRAISGTDTVMIHALYRPNARAWDSSAVFGRHAIEFFSRQLWPYPWPHMTMVEGLIGGGMEFPMITLIGTSATTTPLSLRQVTIHEIAHMWFPMMVGSNERAYTWQDEGFARFFDTDALRDVFPNRPRDSLRTDTYLRLARENADVELMRHGDLFPTERARRVSGYDKPAKVLFALRAITGEDAFTRAVREYGRTWSFKHPTPWDFFNTVDRVTGRRQPWFWRVWFYENWKLDQAIARVVTQGDSLQVVVEDRGWALMPIRLAVTRAGGAIDRIEIPADRLLGRRFHFVFVPRAPTVTAIEIDPEQAFPDIDRSNQRWTP